MYTQPRNQTSSETKVSGSINLQVFDLAIVALACIAFTIVLTVLQPPRLIDMFDVFASPEVLPEWYMLPAFAVIKAMPSKLIGLIVMSTIPASLFALPLLPNLDKYLPGGGVTARIIFTAIHFVVLALGISILLH
jgi:cytochrome b6-f complex subunit 4